MVEGTGSSRRFDELVDELAATDLVRDNPFVVLGAPTTATGPELTRAANEAKLRHRRRDDHAAVQRVDDARRRLQQDPARRLLHELLWRWPDGCEGAEAHNRAVDDLERLVDDDDGAALSRAVRAVMRSFDDPAAAAHVSTRVASLADPRLTDADGRQLLLEARLVVALAVVRRAVRAVRQGRRSLGVELAQAVRTSAGDTVSSEAFRRALEPIRQTVQKHVDAAEAETAANRRKGAECADRLLDQTAADLAVMDALLADDDHLRIATVDEVAEAVLECTGTFFAETELPSSAVKVLERASRLRVSDTARSNLDELLAGLRMAELMHFDPLTSTGEAPDLDELGDLATRAGHPEIAGAVGTCWYCQSRQGWPTTGIGFEMHRGAAGGMAFPDIETVVVPRCRSCAARHERWSRRSRWVRRLWWLALIVLLLSGTGLVLPLIAWVVSFAVLGMVQLARHPHAFATRHPSVRGKLMSGWRMGRPAGAL